MIQKHHGGMPEKKPHERDISGKKHMLMKFGSNHTPLTPHGEVLKKATHGEMEWDPAKHETFRTSTRPTLLEHQNIQRTDPEVILNEVFERHGVSAEKRHDLASLERASGALENDLEGQRAVLRELQDADAAREERMKLVGRIVSIQSAIDIARQRIREHKERHI